MPRSYKWQPHSGGRHAVPQELALFDDGRTLCGLEVTGGPDNWSSRTRYWPTCADCDGAWRAEENILPWPREAGPVKNSRSETAISAASELASRA